MSRPSASTKVIHNLACVSTMEKHFHILRAKFILCPFTLPDDALLSCFLPLFQSYYVSPTVRAVHHFSVLYFALSSLAADLCRCSQVQNGSSAQKPSFGPNWWILRASLFWIPKFKHWSHPLISCDTHRAELMHLLRYRLTTWRVPPTVPLSVSPLG